MADLTSKQCCHDPLDGRFTMKVEYDALARYVGITCTACGHGIHIPMPESPVETSRKPDGYAYRFNSPTGDGTYISFDRAGEIRMPLEAIPYYFGAPYSPAETEAPRALSATERLHNICDALSEQADESPFTREEWERIDNETARLQESVRVASHALGAIAGGDIYPQKLAREALDLMRGAVKSTADYGPNCSTHPGAMFRTSDGCPTCELGAAPYVLDANGNIASASTDDNVPPSRPLPSPVECPKCRTQLAFDGDICGLCNPDFAEVQS